MEQTTTPRPRLALPRAALLASLTVIAVVGGALAGPWEPPLRERPPLEPPVQENAPPPQPEQPVDPLVEQLREIPSWDLSWLGPAVLVLLGTAVLAVLARLLVHRLALRRRRASGVDEPVDVIRGPMVMPSIATLHEGLAGAERRLRSQVRPVDAVIAAWVDLERAAERSGVAREEWETPTEFTVAVLGRTSADPDATRVLLDLYLRARFGDEPVLATHVDQATEAVGTLIRTLAATDEAAPPAPATAPTAPTPPTPPTAATPGGAA